MQAIPPAAFAISPISTSKHSTPARSSSRRVTGHPAGMTTRRGPSTTTFIACRIPASSRNAVRRGDHPGPPNATGRPLSPLSCAARFSPRSPPPPTPVLETPLIPADTPGSRGPCGSGRDPPPGAGPPVRGSLQEGGRPAVRALRLSRTQPRRAGPVPPPMNGFHLSLVLGLCTFLPLNLLAKGDGGRVELGPDLPPRPSYERRTVQNGPLEDAIAACVEADMAAHGTPGAAVAVMLDGTRLFEGGFGEKRRGTGDPVDADTVFRIGSISKQMTAAAAMRLVERGLLDPGEPITRVLPELEFARPGQADAVTVWNLMTHTSGIPDTYNVMNLFTPMTLEEWLSRMNGIEPYVPPGSFWNYSNPNYSLLGLIVERLSGLPYSEVMEREVWDPAGMASTTLDPATVISWGDYSWGHYRSPLGGNEIVYAPDDYDSPVIAPAGGVFSTAPDLVRWAEILMGGDGPVLGAAAAREMQLPQVPTLYTPDLRYGYGIFSQRFEGLDVRQHGGNINGWGAYLIWYAPRRFAVAVLANTTASLSDAAWCITDAVLDPGSPPPPDPGIDPSTWRRFEGSYGAVQVDGTRFDTSVELRGEDLWITFTKPGDPSFRYTTRLEPYAYDTFLMDGNGDGTVDLDLTFVAPPSAPHHTFWFRNRNLVGTHRGSARRAGDR